MSTRATALERLVSVRAELDNAGDLLLAPDVNSVERCSALLEAAAHRIAEFRRDWGGPAGEPEVMEEACKVRRSFVRAARLLESAVRFHENWACIRGAMTGGYTSRGEAAPLQAATRVCVEA